LVGVEAVDAYMFEYSRSHVHVIPFRKQRREAATRKEVKEMGQAQMTHEGVRCGQLGPQKMGKTYSPPSWVVNARPHVVASGPWPIWFSFLVFVFSSILFIV
jgi:hypothetical protein